MRDYTQLTQEERYQIEALLKRGHHQSGIADALNRDKSTISREVRRNRGLRGYPPGQAQRLTLARREVSARPRIAPASSREKGGDGGSVGGAILDAICGHGPRLRFLEVKKQA